MSESNLINLGIKDYVPDYYQVDFRKRFGKVKEVDIFATYARTWLKRNTDYIRMLFEKPGADMKLCLLDPNEDNPSLRLTAETFGISTRDLKSRITEVKDTYIQLFGESGKYGRLRIYFGKYYLSKAFFRLDDELVYVFIYLTAGSQVDPRRQGKTNPALILERSEENPQSLFAWIMSGFESYIENYSWKVFDSKESK